MWLSIMGMYEYDSSVFQGFNVPEGVDREACIHEILLQCAELEIVYPNIDTMKLAIAVWTVSNMNTWEKLWATMNFDYNPIWNVDATIKETSNRDIVSNDIAQNKETRNMTDTNTPGLTDTHSVKGYNSNTWAEADKNEKTGTDTTTRTGTDTFDFSDTKRVDDDNTVTTTRTGNIGVTATQELIQKERDIAEFSIINYIAMSFKERFCILVY